VALRLDPRAPSGINARLQGAIILGFGGLLALPLIFLGSQDSLVPTLIAIGIAGFVCVIAILGPEKTGIIILMGGFFTAPWYKGASPSPASPVTATDLLLFFGFALLLPRILAGRLRLPLVYWYGVLIVLTTGMIASAASVRPTESYLNLTFWMIVMIGLPVAFSMWGPSLTVIDLLASSFVVGQVFSFVLGYLRGYVGQGRHAGMATHPNFFAEGGMLALALLIYLAYRHFGKSALWSAAIVAGVVVCGGTVYLSGSRAAIVVVAVLVLMIPVVERRALTTVVFAGFIGLGIVAVPLIADFAGNESAIGRLLGGGGSSQSNTARTLGLNEGIDRFLGNPFVGDGLVDLFDIHNNFVEVAVAIGVIGTFGYLLVLYAFARPILGRGELRRISYPVWAYIGFGATVPSLYDRSSWTCIGLSVVAMVEFERLRRERHQGITPDRQEPVTPVRAATRSGAAS
jgi:hypothetical protein